MSGESGSVGHVSDALREIGIGKAVKFAVGQVQNGFLRSGLLPPPCRRFFLRVFGATIGRETIVHACSFFNLYRTGFKALTFGHHCFVGDDCLFDCADEIHCGDHVTFAEHVTVLTHTNVGFHSHPLQKNFPPMNAPVRIGTGSFIGANATILPGVTLGERVMVGACSLVREDVPAGDIVAGVPARSVRKEQLPR